MEMIVTFPGMAAQQESESISGNMRWSYKKRMESGEFNCCSPAYGYILKDGQLMINEPQAAVIRRIFDLYLSGVGKQSIANILNDEGVSRRYGQMKWYYATVDYILNNERYMGDALLQKSYTTETLPFRKKRNKGELPKYYVENSNPPIVSREIYQAAQELQKARKNPRSKNKHIYPLSGVMRCPDCGRTFRRQIIENTAYWLCCGKMAGATECRPLRLRETAVYETFIMLVQKLADNRKTLFGDLIRQAEAMQPEIDPEQAGTVKRIYGRFLSGDSLAKIADDLNTDGVPTPSGKGTWLRGTIQSILTNEKYKGDAVLNKTYISDCLTKKVKTNNGERPKYYVENNHPAIIDSATFGRVQEEMARRSGKRKVKQIGTKTEQGKYSGKYALTELLICGECGTPYRRCTWTAKGKKKIVWRCINRLDYGKKYCHHSPSIEESVLQNAIMTAVIDTANQNADILKTLKLHIGMGLDQNDTEDKSLDIQIRIAEIDAEFHKMLVAISSDTVDSFDETKATELMNEKSRLEQQLAQYADAQQKRENAKSRLDEIYTILDGLKNHPLTYDDQIIRQILECVVVESKEKIKVVFVGGLEVEQGL